MGRLKIIQEDDSVERVAYLSDVQPIATDLDNLIDEVEDVSGVGRTTETVKKNADDIASLSQNKVDKVGGKGLSTNDYTTDEKDKLGLIEAEANKTTIANTLTETVVGKALDATQGKILDDKIGVLSNLTTTDKTSLVGSINEIEADLAQHKLDYASQRQQDQLKVAKVEKDLTDYQKTLSQVNVNQEAKQRATGYGIVSLPKNAANGQVSDVVIKGLTATNLVKNGDFSNGTTGWTSTNGSMSAANNTLTVTGDGSGISVYVQRSLKVVYGHKCYVKAAMKVTNSDCVGIKITGGSQADYTTEIANPTINTVYNVSGVATAKKEHGQAIRIRHNYADATSANGKVAEIQNVIFIDLTATFGAGNEPTKEECDKIFANWFDGTKSTVGATRARSVGKNILGGEKFAQSVIKAVGSSTHAYKTTVDNRNVLAFVGAVGVSGKTVFDKFKENTQYTVQFYTKKVASANGGYFQFLYTDGTIQGMWPISTSWEKRVVTSHAGKTIRALETTFGAGAICYYDIDTFQIEEGDTATEYEPYKESTQYLPNVGELRSLPNGVKDEVNLTDGIATQNVSEDTLVSDTVYDSIDTTTYTNVDVVITTAFADAKAGTTGADGQTHYYDKDGVGLTEVAQADIDLEASAGKYYWGEDKKLYIIVAKGDYADIAAARTGLDATSLNYQLAESIITPIQVSGNLISYPSGTVYVENVVADAGIYTTKFDIKELQLPIKSIDKLIKYNFETGVQTVLDTSLTVINEDKKSFTHPNLTDKDMVFVDYYYDVEGTLGETTIEYLDSRYVIKDTTNNKFYKWDIKSTNGMPTIELTEVL